MCPELRQARKGTLSKFEVLEFSNRITMQAELGDPFSVWASSMPILPPKRAVIMKIVKIFFRIL